MTNETEVEVEVMQALPDPTPEMLNDPLFNAIWGVIKTWDVNVPGAYTGYCGADGSHARAIFDAIASRATDTALAEELRADFAAVQGFIAEVGGTCLGLAMSGSNHPDPDGTLMGLFEKAQALPEPLGRILAVLEGKRT